MDANTLLMVGGLAYSWWKSRATPLTPAEAAPTIALDAPADPTEVFPAVAVHVIGLDADNALLQILVPVTEAPTVALGARRRGFGATATAPQYRPAGPIRATPPPRPPVRPTAPPPKPPRPTAMQSAAPIAGMAVATIPLAMVGVKALTGREVSRGEVLFATGATAVGIVAQIAPPVVAAPVGAVMDTARFVNGNISASSTLNYVASLGKRAAQAARFVIPGGSLVWGAVELADALLNVGERNFGQKLGTALGHIAGGAVGLIPGAGMIAQLAATLGLGWLGGKIGAAWDAKQAAAKAKALEGITGESVDALLAQQWEDWGQQKAAADHVEQSIEAWWDSPQGTTAWETYAMREDAYDPALLPEAGAGLSTEIENLPAEAPVPAELTADDLARLGLTDEEIQIYQEGAPTWEGGFGVSQPEDGVVATAPDTAPVIARTWDEMVALSMVPSVVKLVGAWDALINAYAGPGAIAECAKWAAPGSGARCMAVYADGSKTYYDAGTDLSTVPGSILS